MDFNLILSKSVIPLLNCEEAKLITNRDFQGIEYFLLVMSKKNLKAVTNGYFKSILVI